jgi:hypothetical protein
LVSLSKDDYFKTEFISSESGLGLEKMLLGRSHYFYLSRNNYFFICLKKSNYSRFHSVYLVPGLEAASPGFPGNKKFTIPFLLLSKKNRVYIHRASDPLLP